MALTIVKSSSGKQEPDNLLTVLVDGEGDLKNIPKTASPGSIAHTATMNPMWMKANDGSWKQIGG